MDAKTKKLLELLDSSERIFISTPLAEGTLTKGHDYMLGDRKLLSLASGTVCMVSDVFILYGIGHLGFCDLTSLSNFLKALAKMQPSLSIIYEKENLSERLRHLYRSGYIYRQFYDADVVKADGNRERERIALYSVTDDVFPLVSQKIHRNLACNRMIQWKLLYETVAWAAASYVGSSIAVKASLVDYLERVLRTKQVPSYFFPCEMKLKNDDVQYYTAVIPMFLEMKPEFETVGVYEDYCFMKYNAIKNYLVCRTNKGVATVVIVVRDKEELFDVAKTLTKYPQFETLMDRIYFTGEGIVRAAGENVKKAFLQFVVKDGEIDFKQVVPTFMK